MPGEIQNNLETSQKTPENKKTPDEKSKDSGAITELLELLEKEKIELPPGMIARLKLLNTQKCSEGECIFNEDESYDIVVENKRITKKNETHLEHTLELIQIIKLWLPNFLRKEDVEVNGEYPSLRKNMIVAALLHDIGKTGPEIGKDGEKIDIKVNEDFVLLFSIFEKRRKEEGGKNLAECSIREAVERHIPQSIQDRVLDSIKQVRIPGRKDESGKEVFFDPEQNKMKDIFGSHVEFSLEVLREYQKKENLQIDSLVNMLIAKHHRFGNSYNYEPHDELSNSLPDKMKILDDRLATLIELADMYQAMGSRGTQRDVIPTLDKIEKKFSDIELAQPGSIPQYVFDMIKKLKNDQVIVDGLDVIMKG